MRLFDFMRAFPTAPPRTGLLTDIACPQCGQREAFNIVASTMACVEDHEVEPIGYLNWDPGAACVCRQCSHQALVKDFTLPGLDEAITPHHP